MINLSKLFGGYILQLRLCVQLLFPQWFKEDPVEVQPEEKIEVDLPSYLKLSSFLRDYSVVVGANPFSSNNSHWAMQLYGENFEDHVNILSSVADMLLMDRLISHDSIINKRKVEFVRKSFVGYGGHYLEPVEIMSRFRTEALRLVEGYELRSKNLDLGLNTFQNCATAAMIIQDLDDFCKELYHEYRIRYGS